MGINATKYRDRYIKRAARVLPAIQPGVPFTPEAIDQIVGGEYSSKFVFYLRELGFEFSNNKDGRKIVSYTLIKEPADAAAIRGATASAPRGAAKAPKVKAAKPDAAKAATEKTLEALADLKLIKAKNLKTLKEVSARKTQEDNKRMEELADFENSLEEEGARNFVPKFLHKELGIQ